MPKIPRFTIYGDNDSRVEESIQPRLSLRNLTDLTLEERERALKEIANKGWLTKTTPEALWAIEHLNHHFLRICPGRRLHDYGPDRSDPYRYDVDYERTEAAFADFVEIFLKHDSDALILRMLSVLASHQIDGRDLRRAEKAESEEEQAEHVTKAFKKFDRFAALLNRVFEQFGINMTLTRSGFVPMQDVSLTEQVYVPTLEALAHPRWKSVSDDLSQMFSDFAEEKYPEVITKAHSSVQRFLQVLVGQEGKSGKGEVAKLFSKARDENIIPRDAPTAHLIAGIQSLLGSTRATKSTAKPSLQKPARSDALLVMNITIVFMQYCLQTTNQPS